MQSFGEMQSMATNIFSAYASVAASMMLYRSMVNDIIPKKPSSLQIAFSKASSADSSQTLDHMTVVVDEQNGFTRNQIYDAAEIYLRTIINPDAERLKANKSTKQKNISLSMEKGQELIDSYKGFQLKWQFILVEPDGDKGRFQSEKRYFELTFEKQNKDTVLDDYLPFVLAKAKEMKENERAVKLYTRDCPFDNDDDDDGGGKGGGYWGCVNLDHPVTFDKLAMDPNLKRSIIEDLDRFVRRKDYYRKVGKAWKRGYLLYGPPGTGKSSLIAAIANYLRFDVYDLELTSVYSNSELRRILLCTNNKSILEIEDIDCSGQMHDRERDTESAHEDSSNTRLTLSGLLNFIDGLWSTCGDERIIIFTTNHKEKLDPALLRPGVVDLLKQKEEEKKKNEMPNDQKMSDVVENISDEGVDQGKKRKFGRIVRDLTKFRRRSSRGIGKRKMLCMNKYHEIDPMAKFFSRLTCLTQYQIDKGKVFAYGSGLLARNPKSGLSIA
ncbi:UNVERIFIED_CONTAM: AAA-ATPase [Sesamum latifolium]|uniref:AAA-ATPase n=1 Tax=Sesamum latifolium TaxID=2727402 RepID=A0AAW2X2X1_9LAMI